MKSNNVNMMNEYVVVKPGKDKIQKTKYGLEFTEGQTEDVRYKEAIIVKSPIPDLTVGDTIIYDKVAGHNFVFDDGVLRIIKLRDIVGVA